MSLSLTYFPLRLPSLLYLCAPLALSLSPCLASLSFAVLVMHVTTPPSLPHSRWLLVVDSQVACSVLKRLEATRGEATLVVICQAVTFTRPVFKLCYLSSSLQRGGGGIREGASLCTLFIAHLESQRTNVALPRVPFVVHLCLLLAASAAAVVIPNPHTYTHTRAHASTHIIINVYRAAAVSASDLGPRCV